MSPVKLLLMVIPFFWTIGLLPFANSVHPLILGLPFLAFWLSSGIYVTFVCLLILYRMDRQKIRDEQEGLSRHE